jgi:hypothetical protein
MNLRHLIQIGGNNKSENIIRLSQHAEHVPLTSILKRREYVTHSNFFILFIFSCTITDAYKYGHDQYTTYPDVLELHSYTTKA